MPGAAPLSPLRRQAPAGHHRPAPNQPVEDDASHQFAIISGFQLSAIFTKPSAGNPATATNPHRRSSVHRFPAGSFFRGFRTPVLYRIDRSYSGRHPKPLCGRPPLRKDLLQLGTGLVDCGHVSGLDVRPFRQRAEMGYADRTPNITGGLSPKGFPGVFRSSVRPITILLLSLQAPGQNVVNKL